MAAEFMVVNPRHRRRRKARSARRTRVTRRRRRTTLARAANPRRVRRRRHVRARRSTRRRRHNPRGGIRVGGAVGIIKHGVAIAGGAAISEIAQGFISKYLPASLASGPTNYAVRAGLGIIVIPALLKMTPLKRFAASVALGSAVILAWDAYQAYVKPSLHAAGLGVYTPGDQALGVYGGGIEGQGVSGLGFGEDSMYNDSMYT
jgi:hypothetical protein